MTSSHTLRLASGFAASALVAVGLASGAAAKSQTRDRDHDKMPDRWERTYHLNTHVNDARKDADHDGLKNLAEYRDHSNPRRADSDHDGIKDASDVAGTIKSFTDGVLTITAPDGRDVSASVTDETELTCRTPNVAPPAAPAPVTTVRSSGSDDGPGHDGPGHDAGDDDAGPTGPTGATGPTGPTGPRGDDDGHDDNGMHKGQDAEHTHATPCAIDALVAGTQVHEAEMKLSGGTSVWDEVKLILSSPTA